jgi:hypothetical protein
MVQFPVSVSYGPDNAPEWLGVIPEDPNSPWGLTITLESWDRIKFVETNIEGLLVDLPKAITDAGLSVADVQALIAFIRFTAPKLTLILDGTGTDTIEIILPPGVSVFDVRKVTGESVPFFFNTARNSVVITVTFESIVEIELLIASIQNILNRAVTTIMSVVVVASVLNIIFQELGKVVQEVRKRV